MEKNGEIVEKMVERRMKKTEKRKMKGKRDMKGKR